MEHLKINFAIKVQICHYEIDVSQFIYNVTNLPFLFFFKEGRKTYLDVFKQKMT